VLIAGGTSGTVPQRGVLAFDPAAGRVRTIAQLPRALTHAAAATLRGRVLVIGGRAGSLASQSDSVLAVDPMRDRVIRVGTLPEPLSDAGAASIGDRVLVAGGRDRSGAARDELLLMRAVS
jgi:serine/threonine-protein kinase PknK